MDNQMLAYYLMNQKAQNNSPLAALSQGINNGMYMAGSGTPGMGMGGLWENIGKFLSGQSSRKDKASMMPDMMQSGEKDYGAGNY
jgi:hypothetical protein